MIISKQKKFVFIHNPKAGGKSVRNSLKLFDDFDNFFWHRDTVQGVDHPVDKAHITLNDLSKTRFFHYIENTEYFVFGFVRNPYDRVYSAYLEKCRQWKNVDVPFNEFTATLNEINIRYDYNLVHFCPQHYFFYNGLKCFADFIGRLENLPHDFEFVSNLIGLSAAPIPHENKSFETNQNSADITYLDQYDEESIKRINRLYEKDFLLFGYRLIPDDQPLNIPSSLVNQTEDVSRSLLNPLKSLKNKYESCFSDYQHLKGMEKEYQNLAKEIGKPRYKLLNKLLLPYDKIRLFFMDR